MKPYRQGEIDFFCGIYSIVNAVRFSVADFHSFNYDQSCKFYQVLMQYLYDTDELQKVLYYGTEFELMYQLLDVADEYMQRMYGIRILWTVPFKNRDVSLTHAFRFIRKYLNKPSTSCIIRIDNRLTSDHWSVIKQMDNKFFGLFDSTGYLGMQFNKTMWNDSLTPPTKNTTLVSKQGIILIKCVKVK